MQAPPSSPSAPATRRTSPRCASAAGMVGPEPPHRVAQLLLGFERFGLLGGAVVAGGDPPRRPSRDDRRARRAQLQGARRAHQRAGQCVARARLEGRRGRGDPGAQPPRLPRVGVRGRQVRRAHRAAQHLVRGTADPGGGAEREGTDLLVYDDEYADMLGGSTTSRAAGGAPGRTSPATTRSTHSIERRRARARRRSPATAPRITILTSGTTGTPKGAPRSEPRSLSLIGGLLSKVPFRAREVTELCVPMFHALGFVQAIVGVGLGLDARRAPALRPRDDARQPRGAPRDARWSSCR